jgi:hypothetical protein
LNGSSNASGILNSKAEKVATEMSDQGTSDDGEKNEHGKLDMNKVPFNVYGY